LALNRVNIVAMRKATYEAFRAELGRLQAVETSARTLLSAGPPGADQAVIDALRRELAHLRAAHAVTAAERDGYETAYRKLEQEIASARASVDASALERAHAEAALQKAVEERNSTVDALATLTAERDGYKGAMEQVITERDAANTTLSSMTAERDGYRNAYESHGRELGALRVTAAPVVRPKERQEAGAGRRSIFLVTLPKSGTVYVSHALARSLDYDHTGTLVTPTFPKNILWGEMLADFAKGGMISASHMQPDDYNLEAMASHGIRKMVLHVRDPRAALNSWMHFIRDKHPETGESPRSLEYRQKSAAEQLDFLIEHEYPAFANWIADWMTVVETPRWNLNPLIVHHDELASDENRYFQRIFDFYGFDATLKTAAKDKNAHYRKGDNDDWRATFSPAQRARVNDLMPARLWTDFGWKE
jgi:hypothetical protein